MTSEKTGRGKKIGVGVFGLSATGRWAATAHVPALRAIPDFEIRALTASSMATAEAAARKFEVPFFSDQPQAMAERADVDLVIVTVKLPAHRELVTAAIRAGKMVYCEWPLGNGLAEATELASLAEKAGVKTFVGLQARSAPPVHYLRDLVAEGYVGEVLSTSLIATLGQPWAGEVSTTSTYLVDVKNGATMLSIPFGHTVDAMCWMLGDFQELSATLAARRKQTRVLETGEIIPMTSPDQVAVSGILQSGAVANIHYRAGSSRSNGFLWEINGTDGDLVIEGENGHLQYGRVRIRGGRGKDKTLSDLPVPERYRLVDLPAHDLSYTVAHAYKSVLSDIKLGTRLVPSFADALAPHSLIETINLAAETGQRQPFRPASLKG